MTSLVVIEGPTAAGKSKLALNLALMLGSEIISADSRQVYRYLDIGTAKPDAKDLAAVPHHLIDVIDPNETYNAGRFMFEAEGIIEDMKARGLLPIVCGGTGLYVEALLNGLFRQPEIPEGIRLDLQSRLASEGLDDLYRELNSCDPEFAAKISRNDRQRILRGLEIYLATGMPISEHWKSQQKKQAYKIFRILVNPPRSVLYGRIDARVEEMLAAGWLDELKSLIGRGYDSSSPGLNSLGYKELLPAILEPAPLESCAALAAQHTRNYAKRQCTWYRKRNFDLTLLSSEYILSEVAAKILRSFT